jgi:hypothetical protein
MRQQPQSDIKLVIRRARLYTWHRFDMANRTNKRNLSRRHGNPRTMAGQVGEAESR